MRLRHLSAAGAVIAAMVGCSGSTQVASGLREDGGTGSTSGRGSSGTASGGSAGGTGGTTAGTGGTSGATAGGTGSSGTGGSASDGGGDGGSDMGPTPPEPGVNYPFPQNRHYANCTYPAYSNADVLAAYTKWKSDLVTATGANGFRRVQRSAAENFPNETVSEGIGYGMILAVYMNDQSLFDDLWQYEQSVLDPSHLMNWLIAANGSVDGSNGTGSATDADEDMAWGLLMADKQWGTSAKLGAYLTIAKQQISNIWLGDVYMSKLPNLGDNWGSGAGWTTLNISYFAPAYYRVFKTVDPDDDWDATIQTTYDTITNNLNAANGNQSNGLVPGFSSSTGTAPAASGEQGNFKYQYDACRTPFRIGIDWCINGEPRAKAYVALTNSFFGGIGAAKTVDGYQMNGTPSGTAPASPFVGPAGVGAMSDATYSTFAQGAYQWLLGNPQQGGQYYAESWTAISLVMMSGNFLDYTNLP